MLKVNLLNPSIPQLRRERERAHFELLCLKREVDKSYLIHNTNQKSYESLLSKYKELDEQLAELDGRKEICPVINEVRKRRKKEKTSVQELIKQLSDYDRKRLVEELKSLNVPLIK